MFRSRDTAQAEALERLKTIELHETVTEDGLHNNHATHNSVVMQPWCFRSRDTAKTEAVKRLKAIELHETFTGLPFSSPPRQLR